MTLAETFDQLDWATIESYVELKQEEHLHLDFKTLRNAELTSGDDKRNIARCISGFARGRAGCEDRDRDRAALVNLSSAAAAPRLRSLSSRRTGADRRRRSRSWRRGRRCSERTALLRSSSERFF
jgi:hypothetical protein